MKIRRKNKIGSMTSSLFSVGKILDFFAVLITVSAFIAQLGPTAKKFYWFPWLLLVIIYFSCRLAQYFQVLEISVGNSYGRDLIHLDHRLNGFKVDSRFWEMVRNVNREDKLPMGFVDLLRELYDQFQVDSIKLKNKKLQKASQEFFDALKSYVEKLDDELFLEGNWYVLPDNKRTEEPSKYEEYAKQIYSLRNNLIATYVELTNLISEFGGDIRDRVYIASL